MPAYTYRCTGCDHRFELILRPNEREGQTCPECEEPAEQVVDGDVGLVLRGDHWPGKALRIKGQMKAKNSRLSSRQEERKREGPGVRLVPNVGGEEVGSWSEARKLAASKGKVSDTYRGREQKEKDA